MCGPEFCGQEPGTGHLRHQPRRRPPSGSILPFLGEIASIPGSPRLRIRPGMPCVRRYRGNPAAGIHPTGHTVCGVPAYRAHNARSRTTPGESATNPPQDLCRRTAGRYDAAPILRAGPPGVSAGAMRPAPCTRGDPGFRLPAAAKKRRPAKATNPSREKFEVSTDICPHPGAVARGSLARFQGNCRESRPRVRPAWDRI